MDEFRNILQLDLFGIVFCNIGHDAADAAVIFFILSGRGGSLGQRVGAQKLPEVLQSGNDLKFIHRFSLAVKGNDHPDAISWKDPEELQREKNSAGSVLCISGRGYFRGNHRSVWDQR